MVQKVQENLPVDPRGNIVYAVSGIKEIIEVSITAAGFVACTMPADSSCKSIFVTTRDAADILLSHLSAGTRYATLASGFAIDIAAVAADVLFYVKGTSSTTLEILCFD